MNQPKSSPEVDCTRICNSRQHGSVLTSAVTKRAVSDTALASFFRCTCSNFLNIIDYEVILSLFYEFFNNFLVFNNNYVILGTIFTSHGGIKRTKNIIRMADTQILFYWDKFN